jgi:hypothetical protein
MPSKKLFVEEQHAYPLRMDKLDSEQLRAGMRRLTLIAHQLTNIDPPAALLLADLLEVVAERLYQGDSVSG